MVYTEELKFIQDKISELRIKNALYKNILLVDFLNKYKELEKRSTTNNLRIIN